MAEERATEATPLPPYFDRFIEERDRRYEAELKRLQALIKQNSQRIGELRQMMERRLEEVDRKLADVKVGRGAIREVIRDLQDEVRHGGKWGD